jgi:hypothetical protein
MPLTKIARASHTASTANKFAQRGIGFLHIIGAIVLIVGLAIAFKAYKTNEKKVELARQDMLRKEEENRKTELVRGLKAQRAKVVSILNRWEDALKLAGMTSRIALPQPIAQMQAIKREMDELKSNECFEKSTKSMTAGMNDAIFAFEMFVRFPSNSSASDSTAKYLGTSNEKILIAKQELDACAPPSP